MYDVPGSGRHHRRPGGNGRHTKYRRPSMSSSDKIWLAGVLGYMLLMSQASNGARLGLTAVAIVAIVWRLTHHPGDRHRNGLDTTPEEQAEFKRITGEIPVIEPTAVSRTQPVAPTVSVAVQRPGVPAWMPSLGSMLVLGGAMFLKGLSEASEERAEQSHQQMDRLDAALGIPGAWNNYQPTVPAHGTRGWAPGPDAHHFSGGVKVPWQEP